MFGMQGHRHIGAALAAGDHGHADIAIAGRLRDLLRKQPLGRIIAQLRLEDLADAGHRDRIDDEDLLRPGRPLGDTGLGESLEIVRARLRAGLQRDITDRQLAGITVGLADGRRHRHRRVRQQRVLDQLRIDVVAAADDQVLGPAGDEQPPLFVGVGEIAAVQIAVTQRACIVRGIAIARGDIGARHGHHADLARFAGLAERAVRIEPAHHHAAVGQTASDRTQHRLRRRGIDRHQAAGFGHAENFVDLGARHRLEFFRHRPRQQRRPGNAVARR